MIFEYLDLEDFMRARSICQLWRKKFSSPDLCIGIANKYFPLMRADICQICNPKDEDAVRLEVSSRFPKAASKHIKRLRGHYISMAEYKYISYFPYSIGKSRYCNGRIAINKDVDLVVVQDLRSHRTIIIAEENRTLLAEWSLFDQYLIHYDRGSGRNIMRAWSLKDMDPDDRLSAIKLPTSVLSYSAYQDKCGIITSTGDFLIWDIGGGLKSQAILEFPGQYADYKIKRLQVQFQHDNPRHFYIISVASLGKGEPIDTFKGGSKILKLLIQEIQPEKADSVYEFDLHRDLEGSFPTLTALSQPISLEDGCFGFLLGVQETSYGEKLVVVVKFDIHTKAFTTLAYPQSGCDTWHATNHESGFSRAPSVNERTLFWRGQAIVPTISNPLPAKEAPVLQIAMGLDNCNDGGFQHLPFQYSRTAETRPTNENKDLVLAANGTPLCRVAARYRACSDGSVVIFGGQFEHQSESCYRICGDDDFVVLFGYHGYIVWCFDENLTLPAENRVCSDIFRKVYRERRKGDASEGGAGDNGDGP
ncbi:hypothetical protein BGZ60DRAFT_429712 [Tricladium varicosporioides]|nr:hypothetical protein BGZ60DRAFT_429712 [Hymenoscyphus varicosporioides]